MTTRQTRSLEGSAHFLDAVGITVFGLATVGFGILSVVILRQPLLYLLGIVPDDAFYYFQIARHLADSGHSTFDGVTRTNGYHPGWMLLLTVLARFIPDPELLLRSGIVLALLIHLITACALVYLFHRRASAFLGWIAGTCWLLSPLPFLLALQAMETSLYLLALAALVLIYEGRIAPHLGAERIHPPVADLILLGMSLCAAFWARTEGVVVAVVTLGWLAGCVYVNRQSRPFIVTYGRIAVAVGTTFVVGVAPWFVFSKMATGTWVQDSGRMKMLWAARQLAGVGPGDRLVEAGRFLWRFRIGSTLRELSGITASLQGVVEITFICTFILTAAFFRRRITAHFWRTSAWLLFILLATGSVHGLWFRDEQLWHLGEPGFIIFLICFGLAAEVLDRPRTAIGGRLKASVGIAAVAVSMLLCARFWMKTPVRYPWQRDVYLSQPIFERLVPAERRIGCFNAGIPAYFSTRSVVNLDGLVNSQVGDYWRTRTFDRYLRDQGIAYIMDEDRALARAVSFSAAPLSLDSLASHPLEGWPTPVRHLWRVNVGR